MFWCLDFGFHEIVHESLLNLLSQFASGFSVEVQFVAAIQHLDAEDVAGRVQVGYDALGFVTVFLVLVVIVVDVDDVECFVVVEDDWFCHSVWCKGVLSFL